MFPARVSCTHTRNARFDGYFPNYFLKRPQFVTSMNFSPRNPHIGLVCTRLNHPQPKIGHLRVNSLNDPLSSRWNSFNPFWTHYSPISFPDDHTHAVKKRIWKARVQKWWTSRRGSRALERSDFNKNAQKCQYQFGQRRLHLWEHHIHKIFSTGRLISTQCNNASEGAAAARRKFVISLMLFANRALIVRSALLQAH